MTKTIQDEIVTTEKPYEGRSLKNFIVFSAVLYAGIGVGFILNPAGMASGLGYKGLDYNALTDVMATYGGLELSIGIFLFMLCKEGHYHLALRVIVYTFCGFAFGRIAAAIRYGGFYGLHCYWLAFELVYIYLCLVLFRKNNNLGSARSEA